LSPFDPPNMAPADRSLRGQQHRPEKSGLLRPPALSGWTIGYESAKRRMANKNWVDAVNRNRGGCQMDSRLISIVLLGVSGLIVANKRCGLCPPQIGTVTKLEMHTATPLFGTWSGIYIVWAEERKLIMDPIRPIAIQGVSRHQDLIVGRCVCYFC